MYNPNDFKKELQQWMEQMRRSGRQPSLVDIHNYLAEAKKKHNSMPMANLHGFSSDQMYTMIHSPLSPDCPVQLRTLTDEEIKKIPFMRQALHLLNALEP